MSFKVIAPSVLLYFVSTVVVTVSVPPLVVVTVIELSVMLATVPTTFSMPWCAKALPTMSTSVKKVASTFFICLLLHVLVMVHGVDRRTMAGKVQHDEPSHEHTDNGEKYLESPGSRGHFRKLQRCGALLLHLPLA